MLFGNLREDLRHYTRPAPGRLRKLVTVCLNLGLHAVIAYRLSSFLYRHRLPGLCHLVSYVAAVWTGCQISGRATIGKGLAVLHPAGIVIGATAVIGNNCKLAGRNTIGQRDSSGLRPVIGDDFYAGGDVTIGHRVRVGPNAVVLSSLPDDTTAACQPPTVRLRATATVRGTITPDAFLRAS